jgi:hypothetical protein
MSVGASTRVSGKRAIEIAVRTAHIGAMALLAGGHHFGVAFGPLRPWHLLTALTGAALLVSEARHSRNWVHQARGVITLLHVGLVALIAVAPGTARLAIAAALIVGSVGSHLPRSVRKWSLRYWRIMD